jgi:hypothetical protein
MIEFTRHASERLLERNISKEDVEYCLNNYHTSYPDRAGNMIYKADLPNGRGIKVVVKANTGDHKIIITAADY